MEGNNLSSSLCCKTTLPISKPNTLLTCRNEPFFLFDMCLCDNGKWKEGGMETKLTQCCTNLYRAVEAADRRFLPHPGVQAGWAGEGVSWETCEYPTPTDSRESFPLQAIPGSDASCRASIPNVCRYHILSFSFCYGTGDPKT